MIFIYFLAVNIKDKTKENNIETELKAPKKKRKSKKKKENNNIDNKEEFKMVAKKTMPCDNHSF